MIKKLILAIQFLTVIPAGSKAVGGKNMSGSTVYFPLVGFILGAVLAGAAHFFMSLGFGGFALSAMLVVLLVILTGGIHLDGLADTFDGIYGGKTKDEILRIMRDSHAGAMGVIAVACALLLKIALLSCIDTRRITVALLIMCISSRWSVVFAMFLKPYARAEGKAKIFMDGMTTGVFVLATAVAIILSLLSGMFAGLAVFAMSAVVAYVMIVLISRRVGGVTGDILGSVNELTEMTALFIVFMLPRMGISS